MDASSDEVGADELDDDQGMQVDGDGGDGHDDEEKKKRSIDLTVVKEILTIFDSKQLTDKIETSLTEMAARHDELALRDICLSISHVCNFILINSRVKIHKTL